MKQTIVVGILSLGLGFGLATWQNAKARAFYNVVLRVHTRVVDREVQKGYVYCGTLRNVHDRNITIRVCKENP